MHSTCTNYVLRLQIAALVICIIGVAVERRVGAFKCYVCDSKNDMECTENLSSDFRLEPKDCQNITGAKFCIKTTNIYAGECNDSM